MSSTTFIEITPSSWDQAKELGKLLKSCVFRGHENNKWRLSTTIERAAEKYNVPLEYLWEREKNIIQKFKSRAHQYMQSPPKDTENIEWLSLVQDYGGPTRLLDFTHSFYIASFFAVESASQDACVWAVNYIELLVMAMNKKSLDFQYQDPLNPNAVSARIAESYVADQTKKLDFIFRVDSPRLNERLAIQRGVFLFPFNLAKTFEQNLCAAFDYPFDNLSSENAKKIQFSDIQKDTSLTDTFQVIKLNLPRKWHKSIMLDLDSMNIDSASLFPGLDGFSRSLKLLIRQMEQPIYDKPDTIITDDHNPN